MAEPLLTIEGLSAGYGDVRVLWDINLAVAAGEITCIVGSNGAGKTTLLRTISGLVPATSGRIRFAGEDITSLPPDQILARGIAHVPEGRRLFRGLNVRRQPRCSAPICGATTPRSGAISTTSSRCFRSCASASGRTRSRCPAASSRCARSGAGSCRGRSC